MDDQLLRELETAAQILLAPPNLVNNEQRHAAESVFMNFRNAKSPYAMCKQILETTRVDYVLFEVAGLIKSAVIKEWQYLQDEDKKSMREYLFNYVVERSTLPAFVRERILQVVAIMIKRESVEDLGASLVLFLPRVENLVMTGDHSRQLLGCSMISSMMQEFAITLKSSDVGLRFEDHFKAKKRFQDIELKKIFQFCCQALSSLLGNESSLNQQATALLKSLLAISESVLSWNFVTSTLHHRIMGLAEACYERDQNASLKMQAAWRDVILDPQVVDLFFTIYWKIRGNPQLAHHGMTCLVQLGSLNGNVFSSKEVRLQYITNYLQNFIKLVTSVEILDREALGISNIVFKVLLFYQPAMLAELPSGIMQTFLEELTKLTCHFAAGAATEESLCAEDRLYMEGFDRVMEAWLLLLLASDKVSPDLQANVAQQVFNTYVKLHVAPPDGTRGSGRELETEELEENEEVDRVRFRGQLMTVGVMARIVPQHSLPLLAELLENRTRQLGNVLQRLHQQTTTIADNSAVILLFEDLHWLVLIAGFSVSMHSDCERPTVPMELMYYSIKQAAHVETTMQMFGSPQVDIQAIPNGETQTDHVLRVVAAVFRLAHIFKQSMDAKLMEHLSPEVASSVLWFLQRWSATFLLLDEELYTDLSPVFIACHGRDSDGGVWALQFLLDQAITYFVHFHAEPGVLQDAVQLLLSLVQNLDKRSAFMKSEGLNNLLNDLSRLPTYVKRSLYRALTKAGLAVNEGSADGSYWSRLLQPIQDRFKALIGREDSSRSYQDENVKTELLDILECLIGVSNGAHSSTVHTIFSCLGPIMAELPPVMGTYRNYQTVVESILTLHCEVAKCLVTYLTRTEVNRFYQTCLHIIQTYAKWNGGRLSLESDAQDDSFQDIMLLLELLTDLLSKDLLDLAPSHRGADASDENEPNVTASDVALHGLNLIMPLMTMELLKYPALCLKYYKLLGYLSDTFPEKILQLPQDLLQTVLRSVELGLTSFGHEVVVPCCDFLILVSSTLLHSTPNGSSANPALKHFLKLLLDLILSHQINSEYVPNTSSALYLLICCYQQEYQDLVRQLLASQADATVAERLARAFTDLTADLPLVPTRQNRTRFSTKFDRFMVDIYGFLLVK